MHELWRLLRKHERRIVAWKIQRARARTLKPKENRKQREIELKEGREVKIEKKVDIA